ncbi:MAG: hypothetical protein RLZZ324_770 [Candidatus Parcubacteria bacterium]|jgi:hypothetical protein
MPSTPLNPEEEARRKAVTSMWVATGLTFAVIVALWALLLPTMFRSLKPLETPAWLSVKKDDSAKSFDEALKRSQSALDAFEKQTQEQAKRDNTDAAVGRMRDSLGDGQTSTTSGANQNSAEPKTP